MLLPGSLHTEVYVVGNSYRSTRFVLINEATGHKRREPLGSPKDISEIQTSNPLTLPASL